MTDEELMRAYTKGDMEAYKILYQRHKSRVFGFLISRLKSKEEAEEVFQEVFIKLHNHRQNYRPDIPFLPWLFTVIKNTMIDHIRKQNNFVKHIQVDSTLIEDAFHEYQESSCVSDNFTEFTHLSEEQKQMLNLRFNQDLSFTEIAEQMNISQPNARKIVSRAISKLRDLILDKGA